MLKNRFSVLAAIAVLLFTTHPASSRMQAGDRQGVTPGTSTGTMQHRDRYMPGDTITIVDTIWPYFKFVQTYDSCQVQYWIGEVAYSNSRYGNKPLHLHDWNPWDHKPLCLETNDDLTAASRTKWFHPEGNDTVWYFQELTLQPIADMNTLQVGILDTVLFIPEIFDSTSRQVIAIGDPIGMRPCDSLPYFWDRMIYTRDTSVLSHIVLPALGGAITSDSKVALRVRCIFNGDPDRNTVCRIDEYLPDQQSQILVNLNLIIDAWLDTLHPATHKYFVQKRNAGGSRSDFDFLPVMNANEGTVVARILRNTRSDGYFMVTDQAGRKITTIDVPPGYVGTLTARMGNVSSGAYFISFITDNTILVTKKLPVFR